MKPGNTWLIALPLALYLLLSLLYLLAVPVGESPDEPGHLQCIEQVSIDRRLPQFERPSDAPWWSREVVVSRRLCYHMPLYYVLAGHLQRLIHTINGAPLHFEFPPGNPNWGASPAIFAHEHRSYFWQVTEPLTLTVLRMTSVLFGITTLWASYRVTAVISSNHPAAPVLAATFAAGWPQFLYMSRAISNDVLATALAVAVLVLLLDVGQPRRFLLASCIAALAILAKLTMLFTAGAVIITYILEFVAYRQRRSDYLRSGLFSLLVFTVLATLFLVQPTLREDFSRTQVSFSTVSAAALTFSYWLEVLKFTLSSGWARFGWMNVPAPQWQVYFWWSFLAIIGSYGLRMAWAMATDRKIRLALLILAVWTAGVLASYLQINLNRFQPQFRFIFALLPLLSAFTAIGCLQLFAKSARSQLLVILLVGATLLVFNLWLIFQVLVPAYMGLG